MFNVVNCGDPSPPANGTLSSYSHTREGSTVDFQCHEGFVPSEIRTATCTYQQRWIPEPEAHNCILAEGTLIMLTLDFFISLYDH